MKKVLISQRIVKHEAYAEIRSCLDINWGRFLAECGLIPIPVLPDTPEESYFKELHPEGLLLTGGNDLSVVSNDELSLLRDKQEEDLVREAQKRNVPIMGVCRGAQFLAHLWGSKIVPTSGHVTASHPISIEPDAAKVLSSDLMAVNSYHNYGIVEVPSTLIPLARSSDGLIEAFVASDEKMMGIVWHPERETPFSNIDLALFTEFFKTGN